MRAIFFPLLLFIFINNLMIQRRESCSVIDASQQDALWCMSDNVSNSRLKDVLTTDEQLVHLMQYLVERGSSKRLYSFKTSNC